MVTATVLTVVAWGYASPGPPPIARQQRPEAHTEDAGATAIGCDPKQLAALRRHEREAQSHACAEYREQRQLTEDNITQAIRSADAAERQGMLAYRQVRSGFVQTIATVLAFIAAAVAAVFAGIAAYHTKRSADADNDALAEARKAGAAQAELNRQQLAISGRQTDIQEKQHAIGRLAYLSEHRPKIIMRDPVLTQEDGRDCILYSLVNVGGSEATVVESWILWELVRADAPLRSLRSDGHDDLGRLHFESGEVKDLLGPTPNITPLSERRAHLADEAIRTAFLTEMGLPPMHGYFTGSLVYQDAAGHRRRSVFRRRFHHGKRSFIRLDDPDLEYAD